LLGFPVSFKLKTARLLIERNDSFISFEAGKSYPIKPPNDILDKCLSIFEANENQSKIDILFENLSPIELLKKEAKEFNSRSLPDLSIENVFSITSECKTKQQPIDNSLFIEAQNFIEAKDNCQNCDDLIKKVFG